MTFMRQILLIREKKLVKPAFKTFHAVTLPCGYGGAAQCFLCTLWSHYPRLFAILENAIYFLPSILFFMHSSCSRIYTVFQITCLSLPILHLATDLTYSSFMVWLCCSIVSSSVQFFPIVSHNCCFCWACEGSVPPCIGVVYLPIWHAGFQTRLCSIVSAL